MPTSFASMRRYRFRHSLLFLLLSIGIALPTPRTQTQEQSQPPKTQQQPAPQKQPDESVDVLRVETELVQTAVSVVDKKAQFVEGLRPDQFEMRIDGKAQSISFVEQVEMGTARERQQLAAARGEPRSVESPTSERMMTVFLFVDDLHLDASSYFRVRESLLRFIDQGMGENTQVAIVSTSGQIGFLQQLTDDKMVLRKAVERFNFRDPGRDQGRPPISVYQAFAVQEYDDAEIRNYLIQATMHEDRTDTDRMLAGPGRRKAE